MHSSGTGSVTFFWETILTWGAQAVISGAQAVIWGARPRNVPLWRRVLGKIL